jgi:soluble lytic murein transglycosylase
VATARRSTSSGWSGWFWALSAGAGLVALVALISRFDFGEAIREVTLPLRHDDIIRQEAKDEDVASVDGEAISLPATDPAMLAAVIYTESRFRDQTSEAGARGLMQITPDTADTIEKISGGETFVFEDLADPDLNIRYGSFYLRYLLYKYDGNEEAALAAYNAGERNADAWGGSELEVDDIEFPETRDYVENVLERRDEYRKNYADELGL